MENHHSKVYLQALHGLGNVKVAHFLICLNNLNNND